MEHCADCSRMELSERSEVKDSLAGWAVEVSGVGGLFRAVAAYCCRRVASRWEWSGRIKSKWMCVGVKR